MHKHVHARVRTRGWTDGRTGRQTDGQAAGRADGRMGTRSDVQKHACALARDVVAPGKMFDIADPEHQDDDKFFTDLKFYIQVWHASHCQHRRMQA